MANVDHADTLASGVDRWNAWRHRSPNVRPDLSDFKPKGKTGVDDPYDLYLEEADFRRADLRRTVFEDALLRRSRFRGSDLSGATFKSCNLADSSFLETTILGTHFFDCELNNADFSKAILGNVRFLSMDLSVAKNLSSATHKFPSIVSVDTLEKTAKGLATRPSSSEEVLAFLAAAGVPSEYLEIVRKRAAEGAV